MGYLNTLLKGSMFIALIFAYLPLVEAPFVVVAWTARTAVRRCRRDMPQPLILVVSIHTLVLFCGSQSCYYLHVCFLHKRNQPKATDLVYIVC